jgi:hypothetical protein
LHTYRDTFPNDEAVAVDDEEPVTLRVDGEPFSMSRSSGFQFGRAPADDVIGLDPEDMGISARAGRLEWRWNVWWVVNLSTKRPLLVEPRRGSTPIVVACGERHAVTTERITILVPGAVFTHAIEMELPAADRDALRQSASRSTSGTVSPLEPDLSEIDLDVLTAICQGYLESFPRHDESPRSYAEAARVLGEGWTPLRVRKHVERIKARFAAVGVYVGGPRANHELAMYLTTNGMLTTEHLRRLARRLP